MSRNLITGDYTKTLRAIASFRVTTARAVTIGISFLAFNACGDSTSPVDTTYDNPVGTHMATAVAVVGTGIGGVSVSPKATGDGTFAADIKVRVRKAMPNTTYIVQRAPEVGRASSSNGICERALGLTPWSSADTPAAAFLTFVAAGQTAPVSFTTTGAGDGLVDFEFKATAISTGTKFDVMFRLINDAAAPTAIILSQCFTVTVL